MKKAMIVLFCVCAIGMTACYAEIIPETDTSVTFTEKWLPIIQQYGMTLAGTLTALAIILRKIIKSKKAFDDAAEDVKNAVRVSQKTRDEVKAKEGEFGTVKEQIQTLLATERENAEKTFRREEKIMQALKLAFSNMPQLVANKYAQDIERILEDEETEKANETQDQT